MEVMRIAGLPAAALDAAAEFHAVWLPQILALLDPPRSGEDILLVFPPADHTHRLWRLAAVQELARAAAPGHRVNAVAAQSEAGLSAARALIDSGQGITGQYLVLDEASVVSSPS
jgi:hypothetical protein